VIAPLAFLVIRQRWKFLSGSFILLGGRVKRNWVENSIAGRKLWRIVFMVFTTETAHTFFRSLALEFCFHWGIAEVYTTLSFVSDTIAPTLLRHSFSVCQSCH